MVLRPRARLRAEDRVGVGERRDDALAEAPPRRRLRAVAAEPAGARQRERDATGGDERLRVRGVFFFVRVIVVILGSGVPRPAPARAAPLRPLVAPGEERPPSDGDAPRDVCALLPS